MAAIGVSSGIELSTLRRGAIRRTGVLSAYGMANMAPAIATLFVMGAIVGGAGVAAPLVVLWAGIGFLFHVNTTAEFSRVSPSSGSYVTFLGRSFGQMGGGTTGFALTVALPVLGAALIYQMGLWTRTAVAGLFGYNLPWWIAGIALEVIVAGLVIAGVVLSVRVALALFAFEMFVLIAGAIGMLVANSGSISGSGFNPGNIKGGTSGLGVAFPVAMFLFIGASSPITVSEETSRPRRMLPWAVMSAALFGTVIYVAMAWAEGIGFANNISALLKAPYPFLTAARHATPWLGDLVYIAGFTSAMAVLVVSLNVASRIWFSMGRDRLLPSRVATVHGRLHTPWIAALCYTGLSIGIAMIVDWISGPDNGFGYTASFGTIIFVVVYIGANTALPVHYRRDHHHLFSAARHLVVPTIGTLILLYPLWTIVKPTQPRPYNWFGLAVLVLLAAGVLYSAALQRRGVTAGTVLALEEEEASTRSPQPVGGRAPTMPAGPAKPKTV